MWNKNVQTLRGRVNHALFQQCGPIVYYTIPLLAFISTPRTTYSLTCTPALTPYYPTLQP